MSAPIAVDDRTEWLEADGQGGFASGTTLGVRTRRYHALLLTATTPPDRPHGAGQRAGCLGRVRDRAGVSHPPALRAGRARARARGDAGIVRRRAVADVDLSPGRRQPDRARAVRAPRPRRGGAPLAAGGAARAPRCHSPCARFSPGGTRTRCTTRTRRSGSWRRTPASSVEWHPYDGVPAVQALSNGSYRAEPQWYRGFLYSEERARGLDHIEDLAAPGVFQWDLAEGDAVLLLGAGDALAGGLDAADSLRPAAPVGARAPRAVRDAARARRRRVRGAARLRERRSSPAIPGSPTGGATRSSRCAGCASRPAAWTTRGRSCSSGRTSSPRACCPTASSTRATLPSTTRWMPRCGTSSRCTSTSRPPRRAGRPASARDRKAAGRGRAGHPRGARARHPLRHPGRRTTGCSPPASPACSSPGWTPRSATGW